MIEGFIQLFAVFGYLLPTVACILKLFSNGELIFNRALYALIFHALIFLCSFYEVGFTDL